jgi:hypothetical protein
VGSLEVYWVPRGVVAQLGVYGGSLGVWWLTAGCWGVVVH